MTRTSYVVAFLVAAAVGAAPAAADRPARAQPAKPPATAPGCAGHAHANPHAQAHARPVHKPSAPVSLVARAENTAAGWRVVVEATPDVDVPTLEVEVGGRVSRFGATAAKLPRRLSVPVSIAGADRGQDVVVVVRAAGRSRAEVVRVGAPKPAEVAKPTTVRTIRGRAVTEVRP